ncbi:unnamed protein product [Cylindrotheca closterium]|uniref:Uncharacterized protein n=1 Tax=Cylindrotheca closterium TaxID=2856 RepID=A0AAD2G5B5_9STRA|nr:unnamed protein product [Cylindrotheca closterium]
MRGLRYEITRGVDHEVNQTTEWIRAQLKHHPEAVLVFTILVLDSKQHWMAISSFLTNQRGICMQQSDDEAEAWVYPCEVIKGVFMELHRVRSVGAMRSKLGRLTLDDAARMMWAVLRCHQLMNSFIDLKFTRHPKLSGYSLSHLFRHRLTPKNLDSMKAQLSQFQREMTTFNAKLAKKEDRGA